MASAGYTNPQRWPLASGLATLWPQASSAALKTPPIALVDLRVDATRADFGGRVVSQVSLTTLPGNSPGDGSGHGTFVAGRAGPPSFTQALLRQRRSSRSTSPTTRAWR